MAKKPIIELRASEQVTFERKLIMLRLGKISVCSAYLTITSERVVIEKQSRFAVAFGLIGLLLASLMPGEPIIIERSQITAAQRTKFAVNDQVIDLQLQGGVTHTLIVKPHYTAVAEALQKLGVTVTPLAA